LVTFEQQRLQLSRDEKQALVRIKEQLRNKRRTTMQIGSNREDEAQTHQNNEYI